MRLQAYDTALASIYEAVLLPDLWPEAMAKVADACGANLAHGQLVGGGGYKSISNRDREHLLNEFISRGWHHSNPRMQRGLALTSRGFKGLITEQHMFTREELERDPFQQEYAIPNDLAVTAGLVAASHQNSHFVLTVERGVRPGPYSNAELKRMNHLMASISPILALAIRLKLCGARSLLDSVDPRRGATALLDRSGQVLHMAPALADLLGKALLLRGNRLVAADPVEAEQIQVMIALAAVPELEAKAINRAIIIGEAYGQRLQVQCFPVAGAAQDVLQLAQVLIVVDDLCVRPSADAIVELKTMFRLTDAEARLAFRLGNGQSLREAADREAITYESARTRVKKIFAKTETGRQAELALLVARLSR